MNKNEVGMAYQSRDGSEMMAFVLLSTYALALALLYIRVVAFWYFPLNGSAHYVVPCNAYIQGPSWFI